MGNENSCGETIAEVLFALFIAAIAVGLGMMAGTISIDNAIGFGAIAFVIIWIGVQFEGTQKSKKSITRYDNTSYDKVSLLTHHTSSSYQTIGALLELKHLRGMSINVETAAAP
jgi:hypothetical protein